MRPSRRDPPARRARRRLVAGLLAALGTLGAATAARADCIEDAAQRHGVNALVLRAIGWQESRLDARAVGHNADRSTDLGAFQINSVHLPELARQGVPAAALADGCQSAEVAAWHYARQVARDGDTWAAVGAYHSRTPTHAQDYANRIAAVLMAWRLLPPGDWPYPEAHPPARSPAPPPPRHSLAAR